MIKCKLLILVGLLFGCKSSFNKKSPYAIFNCELDDVERIEFKENELTFKIDLFENWTVGENQFKDSTTISFGNSVAPLSDENLAEMSDVELDNHHYNFEIMAITRIDISSGFNYIREHEKFYKQIESKPYNEIVDSGLSMFNREDSFWILLKDKSCTKVKLNILSIATSFRNDKYLYAIIFIIGGDLNVESRMCEMMNTLKTFEIL